MYLRPLALFLGAGLSLGLAGPSLASDGFGFRSGFAPVSGIGGHSWNGPRRGYRPRLGDHRARVAVVVQNVFVTPPPAVFRQPTVLDLPVSLGIREAKPAQPAVYVLNEGGRNAVQGIRISTGPRIIDVDAESGEGSAPGFGAKIIHLSVPAPAL